jgi:hypothetical protein
MLCLQLATFERFHSRLSSGRAAAQRTDQGTRLCENPAPQPNWPINQEHPFFSAGSQKFGIIGRVEFGLPSQEASCSFLLALVDVPASTGVKQPHSLPWDLSGTPTPLADLCSLPACRNQTTQLCRCTSCALAHPGVANGDGNQAARRTSKVLDRPPSDRARFLSHLPPISRLDPPPNLASAAFVSPSTSAALSWSPITPVISPGTLHRNHGACQWNRGQARQNHRSTSQQNHRPRLASQLPPAPGQQAALCAGGCSAPEERPERRPTR